MKFVRHHVFALVATLALAGACLAAPSLAIAEDSVSTAVSVSVVKDVSPSGTYALGGLQCTLPGDYLVEVEGGVMYAQNADDTLVVAMLASGADAAVPQDPAVWGEFFGQYAQAAAAESDAEIAQSWPTQLKDGAEAYAYQLEYTSDGVPVVALQTYVPMADGSFGLFQIAMAQGQALADEAAAISQSVVRTTPEARVLAVDGIVLTRAYEVGGLRIAMPASLLLDEASAAQEPNWYSVDGSFMVGVIPALVEELSTIGTESLDLIAEGIVAGLDGTLESAQVVGRVGGIVYLYTFAFSDDGAQYAGVLALVPLADNTVTGVLALAPSASDMGDVGRSVAAIFNSIEILAAE